MACFSKGGKIQYFCCECQGPNIRECLAYGQHSVICDDCHKWYPWKWRIKRSLKKMNNERT